MNDAQRKAVERVTLRAAAMEVIAGNEPAAWAAEKRVMAADLRTVLALVERPEVGVEKIARMIVLMGPDYSFSVEQALDPSEDKYWAAQRSLNMWGEVVAKAVLDRLNSSATVGK